MAEGSRRGIAVNAPLSRFGCGHVGRVNESWRSKVSVFIRVAEIRSDRVDAAGRKCPDCS
jgi:hypothetical protein